MESPSSIALEYLSLEMLYSQLRIAYSKKTMELHSWMGIQRKSFLESILQALAMKLSML
jgi:hypothetical protein